jgi:hypothetical protein
MVAILRRILAVSAACGVLLYGGDYLSVRYRFPGHRAAFGSVQVHPYYAIPQKGGKEEIVFQDPETLSCVNSLFPHLGSKPCWYVRRHVRERIDM